MDSNAAQSDDAIDFDELYRRMRRGFAISLALTLIGFSVGIVSALLLTTKQPAVSSLRVTFGFPGFEKGNYPDGTKFQPDDVRAPDVINEAIKRLGIRDLTPDLSSRIRGAIGISGFVPANIVKERDRLRAMGQNLPPYFADEYEITLSLPRDHSLDIRQRELLLAEIVNVYLGKFRRTYVMLPPEFGNAFAALKSADFVEYELILTKEIQSVSAFLVQKMEKAKQFRSPNNNLSFQDLLKQTELFTQIRLNEVLGLIYINGLSKDRNYAMVKMDYYLRTLEDQEQRLKEEELVVTGLLNQTQSRAQSYVVATKTQPVPNNQPMLDQGFIDSLLANDAYNFLVRRALEAGLAVKRIQSEIAQLQQRRERIVSFMKGEVRDQATAIANTREALLGLEIQYHELLKDIAVALDDYSRQEFADAVRISMQARTDSIRGSLLFGALLGCATGAFLGTGLSLLRPAPGRNRTTAT